MGGLHAYIPAEIECAFISMLALVMQNELAATARIGSLASLWLPDNLLSEPSRLSSCNFFCAALERRFAMAAPIRVRPTLLTLINNAELEDRISSFMADDKFIVLAAQANSEAHRESRLRERRFSFVLSMEHGYTGIAGEAQD